MILWAIGVVRTVCQHLIDVRGAPPPRTYALRATAFGLAAAQNAAAWRVMSGLIAELRLRQWNPPHRWLPLAHRANHLIESGELRPFALGVGGATGACVGTREHEMRLRASRRERRCLFELHQRLVDFVQLEQHLANREPGGEVFGRELRGFFRGPSRLCRLAALDVLERDLQPCRHVRRRNLSSRRKSSSARSASSVSRKTPRE